VYDVRPGPRILARVVGAALTVTLATGTAVAAVGLPEPTQQRPATGPAAAPANPLAPAAEPARDQVTAPFAAVSPSPVPPPAPQQPAVPDVAPLQALHAADLLVTVPAPLTPDQVTALQTLEQVTGVALIDTGTVQIGGQETRLVGVDPSQFRQFTPLQTAESDPLWQVVARGELTASHGIAKERSLELGEQVTIAGATEVTQRLGALASYGLPDIDAVTDRPSARELGVVPDSGVLLSAPEREIPALRKAVEQVVGADAAVTVLRPEQPKPVKSAVTSKGKPQNYRDLYIDSARYCPGLDWRILASIGQVESGHGKNLGPSSAGALGPMQFMPATWAAYGVDGDGDGAADIMNPFDAVPSAASYLCRSGANRGEQGLYDAIFAYNHADWYVRKVLGIAGQYS
jgi:hypothetical protein